MNDDGQEATIREKSVRAFLVALATAIRSFDQDLSQTRPGAFQKSFLGYLDGFLLDFHPEKNGDPGRWEEINDLRAALQVTLENPKIQIFDPPVGPMN